LAVPRGADPPMPAGAVIDFEISSVDKEDLPNHQHIWMSAYAD
jgi:hypothetical protein